MKITRFFSSIMILALSGLALGGSVHFFAEKDCSGVAQYEETNVTCGTCVNSSDESGAARVGSVSSQRRVTVHALSDCAEDSITVETYGGFCGIQGANPIRSVKIHCREEEARAAPAHRRRRQAPVF
ncbi:hypothetical protein BDV93DRAFT_168958 [Ceratobasidium sp. AG-I]|nr:hypothetical protein BDV93DRAFT_168958 [Ceratobasidium sp. AG-I]